MSTRTETVTAAPAAAAPAPEAAAPAATPAASATATAAPEGQDRTGARTEEAAGKIAAARELIDDLDRQIIALVQERMAVSAQIQRARIASGGRRVNLSREMEILTHFREKLGRPGTQLAMTLLELCRGRI